MRCEIERPEPSPAPRRRPSGVIHAHAGRPSPIPVDQPPPTYSNIGSSWAPPTGPSQGVRSWKKISERPLDAAEYCGIFRETFINRLYRALPRAGRRLWDSPGTFDQRLDWIVLRSIITGCPLQLAIMTNRRLCAIGLGVPGLGRLTGIFVKSGFVRLSCCCAPAMRGPSGGKANG